MNKVLYYKIDENSSNKTVKDILLRHGYSSRIICKLKKTDLGISVNGELVYTTYVVKCGDILKIKIVEDDGSTNITPIYMPLDIRYEDEDILVINKPSKTPVHPTRGNFENTIANGVAHYYKNDNFTFRCVNRIDKDTTGLILIAKNAISATILYNMMRNHKINRKYIAITEGNTPDKGTINEPIARSPHSLIERIVDPISGSKAITHFKLICHGKNMSLISLKLETGRTHQIRVHMSHIGHPLIGDFLYNKGCCKLDRQALHSYKLSFQHPITGKSLILTAPIPQDMSNIMNDNFECLEVDLI